MKPKIDPPRLTFGREVSSLFSVKDSSLFAILLVSFCFVFSVVEIDFGAITNVLFLDKACSFIFPATRSEIKKNEMLWK